MDRESRAILERALKEMEDGESFERALGRIIRKEKGDYRRYVDIIGEVREFAYARHIDALEAARRIAGSR